VCGTLLRLGTVITYQALNEALDKHFTERITSTQARSTLFTLKQGPEQSVAAFARELEDAGRAYYVNEPESFIQENLYDLFVKGLRGPEEQLFCKYAPKKTLEDAVKFIASSSAIELPATTKKIRLTETTSNEESTYGNQDVSVQMIRRDPARSFKAPVDPSTQQYSPQTHPYQPQQTYVPRQAYRPNAYTRAPGRVRGRPEGSYNRCNRRNDQQPPQQQQTQRSFPQGCLNCASLEHRVAQCPFPIRQRHPRNHNYYKTAVTWYNQAYPPNSGLPLSGSPQANLLVNQTTSQPPSTNQNNQTGQIIHTQTPHPGRAQGN